MDVARVHEAPAKLVGLPILALADWQERFGVVAGVSRAGRDFRLDGRGPDAWLNLLASLSPRFDGLVVSRQVHGARVEQHGTVQGVRILDGLDGHVTRSAGLLLAVTVADCVPVYLVHPQSRTVGLLHAGWRGAAAGILERGLSVMAGLSGCDARDVVMHCGVAICGRCYEVGPEVFEALRGTRRAQGPLDLRQELAEQAQGLGVSAVTVSDWCTAHDAELYSHRASHGRAGRLAAFLGVAMP